MDLQSEAPLWEVSLVKGKKVMDADEKRRRKRRCCIVATVGLVGVGLLLSVLGATVFRARKPVTTVKSVVLKDLDVALDALAFKVRLNVSLDTAISVKNPNRVGLKYTDSSAFLDYRGRVVGQAPIPAGHISAGQTLPINLTLTLMADRFLSNSRSLISDLLSGTLPLSTHTRISGKVSILFVRVHVVSFATCFLNISVSSRSLSNSDCNYDTRLS